MIPGKEFFDRIISQVEVGFLFFIPDYLRRNNGGDMAGIRCLQLLISFHFELLLKARYMMKKSYNDNNEVEKELRLLGHNLENISRELGQQELNNIGIKSILTDARGGYNVETDEGRKIYIEDFINIRYDFITGRIRTLPSQKEEDERVRGDINAICKIIEKVKLIEK